MNYENTHEIEEAIEDLKFKCTIRGVILEIFDYDEDNTPRELCVKYKLRERIVRIEPMRLSPKMLNIAKLSQEVELAVKFVLASP